MDDGPNKNTVSHGSVREVGSRRVICLPCDRKGTPLPLRRVLIAVFVPNVYLPDFITSASRELMFSADRFCTRTRRAVAAPYRQDRKGRPVMGGGDGAVNAVRVVPPSSEPCCQCRASGYRESVLLLRPAILHGLS